MRFICLPLSLALLLFFALPGSAETTQHIQEAERFMQETADQFLAAIGDVDAEQWQFKTPEERHTIGALAEYAALATGELQRMIRKALASPANPDLAKKIGDKRATIKEVMMDEEKPPHNFKPRGTLASREEVLEYYQRAHRDALQLLRSSPNPQQHVSTHPSKRMGDLTALQWFYYMSYLTRSNTMHINKMKAAADYPKS